MSGLYKVSSSLFKPFPWFECSSSYRTYALYVGNNRFVLDRTALYFDNILVSINNLNYKLICVKTNYDLFLSLWEVSINQPLQIEKVIFSNDYISSSAIDISNARNINIKEIMVEVSPTIYLNLYNTNKINLNEIIVNDKGHIIGIARMNDMITPSSLIELFINNMFETIKNIPLKIKNNVIEDTFNINTQLYIDDIIISINNEIPNNNFILKLHEHYQCNIKIKRDGYPLSVDIIPQPHDDLLKIPYSFHEYYINLTKKNFKIVKGYIFAFISYELINIYEKILGKTIKLSTYCESILKSKEIDLNKKIFGKKNIYLIDYYGNKTLNFPFKNNNELIWYKITNINNFDEIDENKIVKIKHKNEKYNITF